MKILQDDLRDLNETGVYQIKNLINDKVYIGSSETSFISRYKTHYEKLRTNNHIGYEHLQNAVNYYGVENFEFSILEICNKEECISRETNWIDIKRACDKEFGYNTNPNPSRSPFSIKEVRDKAAKTFKERYKLGLMKPNSGVFTKGLIPWNKGKKYLSTDHLKVKKSRKGSRKNFSKKVKEKQLPITVYSAEGIKIGEFRYHQDITEESLRDNNMFSKHMILYNPRGRNGYSPYFLRCGNIQKSCSSGKPYKGLLFKYRIDHDKSDKLLETPEEDNQQPIIDLND